MKKLPVKQLRASSLILLSSLIPCLVILNGCSSNDTDNTEMSVDAGTTAGAEASSSAGADTDTGSDAGTDDVSDAGTDAGSDADAGQSNQMTDLNEIKGVYADAFGSIHEVSQFVWVSRFSSDAGESISRFWVETINTDENFLIAKNDGQNEFSPDLFSRFEWTLLNDQLYFCQSVFDGATATAATEADRADSADPVNRGCGDFGWSALTRNPLAVNGNYSDSFGGTHEVSDDLWLDRYMSEMGESVSQFSILAYSNKDQSIIAQNNEDNDFNPSLFSRFDWVDVEGQRYYCQTRFDAMSAVEAYENAPADSSDPANSGCGDFGWTAITLND